MTQDVSEQEYTKLENCRSPYGNSYRAIHQLHKELMLSRNTITVFDKRYNTLGVFMREGINSGSVYVYEYNYGVNPTCIILPDGEWVVVNLKQSELCRIEELVDTVKRVLNGLIIKGE